jgi:hypothetical protein
VERGRRERVAWANTKSAALLVQSLVRAAEQRKNLLGIYPRSLLTSLSILSFSLLSRSLKIKWLLLLDAKQAALSMQTSIKANTAHVAYLRLKNGVTMLSSVSSLESFLLFLLLSTLVSPISFR